MGWYIASLNSHLNIQPLTPIYFLIFSIYSSR